MIPSMQPGPPRTRFVSEIHWTDVDGVLLPCVKRFGSSYVAVRMVEHIFLKKYPADLPPELKKRGPLPSVHITLSEANALNSICVAFPNYVTGKRPYSDSKDLIVLLDDFVLFLMEVKKYFASSNNQMGQSASNMLKRSSGPEGNSSNVVGGWLQVNNTIIPYVMRGMKSYMPLPIVRFAAGLLVDVEVFPTFPSEPERAFLQSSCTRAGMKITFDASTELVDRTTLIEKCAGRVLVVDLPGDNPLKFAQYQQAADQPSCSKKPKLTNALLSGNDLAHKANVSSLQPVNNPKNFADVFSLWKRNSDPKTPKTSGSDFQHVPSISQTASANLDNEPIRPVVIAPLEDIPSEDVPRSSKNGGTFSIRPVLSSNFPAIVDNLNAPGLYKFSSRPPGAKSHGQSTKITLNKQSKNMTNVSNTTDSSLPETSSTSLTVDLRNARLLSLRHPSGTSSELAPGLSEVSSTKSHASHSSVTTSASSCAKVSSSTLKTGSVMSYLTDDPQPPACIPGTVESSSSENIFLQEDCRTISSSVAKASSDGNNAKSKDPEIPSQAASISAVKEKRKRKESDLIVDKANETNSQEIAESLRDNVQHLVSCSDSVASQVTNITIDQSSASSTSSSSSKIQHKIRQIKFNGKMISCLVRGGRHFALVEALSRLYFSQVPLSEFQNVLENVLKIELEELTSGEEQTFINYFGLPIKKLLCNKVILLQKMHICMARLVYMFKSSDKKPLNSTAEDVVADNDNDDDDDDDDDDSDDVAIVETINDDESDLVEEHESETDTRKQLLYVKNETELAETTAPGPNIITIRKKDGTDSEDEVIFID